MGIKDLYDQSSRAMFSLMSKCCKLDLPLDIQFELFDKTIIPLLTYGCEVWGYEKLDLLEKLHLNFCKRVLRLKKSTGSMFIYGELGRYPLPVMVQTKIVNYWCKLINSPNSRLNVLMYNTLHDMYKNNVYNSKWLMNVKMILDSCGLTHVFNEGTNVNQNWLKMKVKRCLEDQFQQKWISEMSSHTLYDNYRNVKDRFMFEDYLIKSTPIIRQLLLRFRCSNHRLEVEVGRHIGIPREYRHCKHCSNTLGDEYHHVIECKSPNIVESRNKYIPKYYTSKPSMFKYVQFMNRVSESQSFANKLGLFLKNTL